MIGIINFLSSGVAAYGFIQGEDGASYYFQCKPDEFLVRGSEVEFEVRVQTAKTRGMRPTATNVRPTGAFSPVTETDRPSTKDPSSSRQFEREYTYQDTLAEAQGRAFSGSPEEAMVVAKRYDNPNAFKPFGSRLFLHGYFSRS